MRYSKNIQSLLRPIHAVIWRRQWQATPVLLPRQSHGWRSLVGCSPWGRYESDTTERLHFHFSLSHNGEGNGNPLQCSCLENPRDGGAWWAVVYGVAQSRTRLKRLSSSSGSSTQPLLFRQAHFTMLQRPRYMRNLFISSWFHRCISSQCLAQSRNHVSLIWDSRASPIQLSVSLYMRSFCTRPFWICSFW